MNTIEVPIPTLGIDFGWEVFKHILGDAVIKGGLHQVMNLSHKAFGDNYVVQGCYVVGSAVSEGLIFLGGELLYVPAHTKTGDYFQKVISNNTTWTVKDRNGNTQNIFKYNRATLSAASGLLKYDGTRILEIIMTSDIYVVTRYAIGDWDMDTNSSKEVTLSPVIGDVWMISSIEVLIRNDSDIYIPINTVATTGVAQGGIGAIETNKITLLRTTGGIFDTALFNQTSYNRGYVTIMSKLA